MSGYVYNPGNELTSRRGLVDIVRLSPLDGALLAYAMPALTKTAAHHYAALPRIAIRTATGSGWPGWRAGLAGMAHHLYPAYK